MKSSTTFKHMVCLIENVPYEKQSGTPSARLYTMLQHVIGSGRKSKCEINMNAGSNNVMEKKKYMSNRLTKLNHSQTDECENDKHSILLSRSFHSKESYENVMGIVSYISCQALVCLNSIKEKQNEYKNIHSNAYKFSEYYIFDWSHLNSLA